MTRRERAQSSMIWAAWADALGFISELTNDAGLVRRLRGAPLTDPVAWTRRVGGRMGVPAPLPEGCYSDDTQLRLATSRAIGPHGFDIEAFAAVELTVWANYALGGGRGTRAAATGMTRQQAHWANNEFRNWTSAGGNGAAMRIQPHVYAAQNLSDHRHLDDVICNAVITHGHPRGIVGAVFHAATLTTTLDRGTLPTLDELADVLAVTRNSVDAFTRVSDLTHIWRPRYERATGSMLADDWHVACDEIDAQLQAALPAHDALTAAATDRRAASNAYAELVTALRLDDPSVRGSGTHTTVAATVLALALPHHPAAAAQVAANALGTDTDTIATMSAALVGATTTRLPNSPVQDLDYLRNEADRLTTIASGKNASLFPYPDLLTWQAPRAAIDAVGTTADGQLALAGIAPLTLEGDPVFNADSTWQWARTPFGQTLLVKRRPTPRTLPASNLPRSVANGRVDHDEPAARAKPDQATKTVATSARTPRPSQQPSLFDHDEDLDETVAWLAERGYRDADIGRIVKRNAHDPAWLQQLIARISNAIASS